MTGLGRGLPRRGPRAARRWTAGMVGLACIGFVVGATTSGGVPVATAADVAHGTTTASTAARPSPSSSGHCPVATPAQAASTTVGPPTAVRALSGSGSLTVTWCPPVEGQAHVTGYTVASSNGLVATTEDPNDWDIVTGLTDGTPYTFTVTATTGAATTTPPAPGSVTATAATSRPSAAVAPKAIRRPTDVLLGKPRTVTYDQYSLLIGGKRTMIYSGEMDPWRLASPSLWLDRLEKMKADGYNAVTPYFDWDYTSPAPGVYDFGGIRDMNTFLNMAQEAGLYVIARPGPYINAETDGGGIPSWVLSLPGGYRTDSAPYLAAADQWFSEIDPIIAAHQITRGGDVILDQIENEYGGQGTAAEDYMANLESRSHQDGISVPFTFNECCGGSYFSSGTGAVNISGQDNYPLGFDCADPSDFSTPYSYPKFDGEPTFVPEFQGGSFDAWGGTGYDNCYRLTGPDFENVFYKSNLAQGVTVQSNYMAVGGTNWGWLPDPDVYSSYDYGSAIRETGEIGTPADPDAVAGSKYGENKLIGDFEQAATPLTETEAAAAPSTSDPAVDSQGLLNPSSHAQFVYLRQADATSTATVSTHVSLNLGETGSYTYDDTSSDIAYSGSWTHADTTNANYTGGDYDGTESFSDTAGDTLTAPFTGTAVQVVGPTDTNGGIADVYIDGTEVGTFDSYRAGGKTPQQILYSTTGLSDGPHTLKVVVTGTADAASTGSEVVLDAVEVPTAAQQADDFPSVPQKPGTSITLDGRDSKLLIGNWHVDGQQLVYSTSELMTQHRAGDAATAVLYGNAGTDGETVLHYTSRPTVHVLAGKVSTTWDPSRDDLRLDYVHHGLAEVRVSGGGRPTTLTLLLTATDTAEKLWPETTASGPALVEGTYLVRTASSTGHTLALTGDTSTAGQLRVWASPRITAVTWDGRPVRTYRKADGSLVGTVGGPAPVTLPKLDGWRFQYETEEAQPGFDDSSWTLADDPVTTDTSASPTPSPVLYADDYGFHHGFVWYRGHFTATGSETGVTLTADGIAPTGAFSVWLNGSFLGSNTAGGEQTETFDFPPGLLQKGKANVIAVLVEDSDHPEGPTDEAVGLYTASLAGSPAHVTWRIQGDTGGTDLTDPVRGVMNAAGLYGSNHGWDLPGYPDRSWQKVSLPDSWSARGVPAGIGWYRTTFDLALPRTDVVPMDVQIDGKGPGIGSTADQRAFIYVNGWLIGRYVNNVGPQHQFYVPAGILHDDGDNTIAVAVWGLDSTSGGLGQVSLVDEGLQRGGVPVTDVDSPGYRAATYGAPTAATPTVGLRESKAVVSAGAPLALTTTVHDPGPGALRDTRATLDLPAGWSASRHQRSVGTVPSGASRSVSWSVTPPASGLAAGPVDIGDTVTYRHGGSTATLRGGTQVVVPAASLAATFDNAGITDDTDTDPSSGFVGFDGEGTSFSAEGLAADGITPGSTVSADGLDFTWPAAAAGEDDNTMAQGQVIDLTGKGSTLGFVVAANNSALSGTGTVTYTDGTTSTFTLGAGNFFYASGQDGNPTETQVATVDYANYATSGTGPADHPVYVFATTVPLDPSKTVAAVTLPSLGSVAGYNAALHVFAMSVGTPT